MIVPRVVRLWVVVSGLPVLATGCNQQPSAVTLPPPKITVQSPESRPLTDFAEYNGWIDADRVVEVRSRVRGHIQKVHFTDGQIVEAGDLLFELDPRPFQAEIDRAQEQVRIHAALREAAIKEEARLRELLAKGGASQSQVDKAEADAKSLAAQIASAQEEVRRRALDLEYSQIKAEIGGRVGRATLQEGNLVNAGGSDPLLTTVVSVDRVRVYFNIDERILMRFAKNMRAAGKNPTELMARLKDARSPFTFALDGEKEFAHKGTLRFGDNRIDPATGTLQVYGTAANQDGKLIPGSRVRVRLPVGEPYPALLVPETAILADQDKRYILVADAENVVRRKNVVLGRLTDDGMRAIQPESTHPADPPEKWAVLVDNLQRARLNYPIEPQRPAGQNQPPTVPGGTSSS
jgi:RND family efflux transporter MFP subunit